MIDKENKDKLFTLISRDVRNDRARDERPRIEDRLRIDERPPRIEDRLRVDDRRDDRTRDRRIDDRRPDNNRRERDTRDHRSSRRR